MAARVVEICDALKAYIDAQTYSFTFTTERVNPAHHRLEASPFTALFIYPGPEGPTTATRAKWKHTYTATLHLVNYVDSINQSEIDDLFLLMEEVIESVKDAKISGRYLLEFSTEDNPEDPFIEGNLITMNLAQSARRLVYQEWR